MFSEITNTVEDILKAYQDGENYDRLLEAKEKYFDQTGMLNDDDDDYEHRMTCFNDWFVFHYELPSGEKVFEKYFASNDVSEDVKNTFSNINFSFFEFSKTNFKKQIVLKDILHDKKVVLPKDHHNIGLFQDDVFLGRTIEYKDNVYLMRGMRILPGSIKSIIKKQCKKIRKANDTTLELPFLLELESLLTKSRRYSHIEPSKIFVF